MKIRFLGHASFIIEDEVRLAVDPYEIKVREACQYIFITHAHYDHCSPEAIARLADPQGSVIIATPDCVEKVRPYASKVVEVKPGKEYQAGIRFQTVPAYNIGKSFHPKEAGWVGYIIHLSQSVYHCGDTDVIPEMKNLKPDIALIPVGGTYTMNSQEALQAIELIAPGKVIPMHYGKIVGSRREAEYIKSHAKAPVEILEPEP